MNSSLVNQIHIFFFQFHNFFLNEWSKMKYLGQQDGPAGTGTCYPARWPDLNPWNPEGNQLHKVVFWLPRVCHGIHKVKEKCSSEALLCWRKNPEHLKFSGESKTLCVQGRAIKNNYSSIKTAPTTNDLLTFFLWQQRRMLSFERTFSVTRTKVKWTLLTR